MIITIEKVSSGWYLKLYVEGLKETHLTVSTVAQLVNLVVILKDAYKLHFIFHNVSMDNKMYITDEIRRAVLMYGPIV